MAKKTNKEAVIVNEVAAEVVTPEVVVTEVVAETPAAPVIEIVKDGVIVNGVLHLKENIYKLPLGRPSNPNSERQKRLAEMEAKRAAGVLKKGRPIVADSERQKRLAELETKRAAGGVLKKGRPISTDSERQKRLAERQKRIEAGIVAQLGRPKMTTAPTPPVAVDVMLDDLDIDIMPEVFVDDLIEL